MTPAADRDQLKTRVDAVKLLLNVPALVGDLFSTVQRSGFGQALVCCPIHGEEHASCNVNLSSGLFKCHACGAAGDIFTLYQAARGCDFMAALADLEARCGIYTDQPAPNRSPGHTKKITKPAPTRTPTKKQPAAPSVPGRVVAEYPYKDAAGYEIYKKQRIEPGPNGKKKGFNFKHKSAGGSYRPGRGDNEPLLYRLPDLAATPAGSLVFVCEGEKCCDALAELGLLAVCNDSGAGGKWPSALNDFFTGKDVVILPDADEPGERYAARVAAELVPVAASVKLLRLPGLPPKGDIIDWLNQQLETFADV